MKVAGKNNMDISKIYMDNQVKAARGKNRISQKYDVVEISKEGLQVAKYAAVARSMPDVRIEKIEAIKSRIQNGTYKVSSEELAKKILEAVDKGNW